MYLTALIFNSLLKLACTSVCPSLDGVPMPSGLIIKSHDPCLWDCFGKKIGVCKPVGGLPISQFSAPCVGRMSSQPVDCNDTAERIRARYGCLGFTNDELHSWIAAFTKSDKTKRLRPRGCLLDELAPGEHKYRDSE